MKLPKLIIITGPTASGKTALSLKLAKKIHGEIISADSRQIYRGMDIGTAKPSRDQRSKGIRHHLIDIRNPDQPYTLAEFKRDAIKAINTIAKRGRVPFLVGGTALYIWAILENPEIPEVKPNSKFRNLLERQLQRHGVQYLYKKLILKDPEAACIIDPKNPRRIIRALEIMHATGKPFSDSRKKGASLFDCMVLGMKLPPAKLKKIIKLRAAQQLRSNLISEVRRLTKKYGIQRQAFDAIGYREIISHLNGQISKAEALKQIQNNTWVLLLPQNHIIWVNNIIKIQIRRIRFQELAGILSRI